jgi:hypothetical protein
LEEYLFHAEYWNWIAFDYLMDALSPLKWNMLSWVPL